MFKVSFSNPAGELDSRVVETCEDAVVAAVEMIEDAAELHDGDTITVTEIEGD